MAWDREQRSMYPVCLNSTPSVSESSTSTSIDLCFQHHSSWVMDTDRQSTFVLNVISALALCSQNSFHAPHSDLDLFYYIFWICIITFTEHVYS